MRIRGESEGEAEGAEAEGVVPLFVGPRLCGRSIQLASRRLPRWRWDGGVCWLWSGGHSWSVQSLVHSGHEPACRWFV